MNKKILFWEIGGMIFIIFLGSFMHFLFELSGYWAPIGAISAVNESIWEHLKLGYFPLVFFTLIQYNFIKKDAKNIALAKYAASLIIVGFIIIFFYTYVAILGEHLLLLDILSFIISIILAQLVSYKLLTIRHLGKTISIIALIGIITLGLVFVLFTYFPPHLPLFQHGITGEYGIVIHGL